MKLSVKWNGNHAFMSDSQKTGVIMNGDNKICEIRAWGFHSCACHALENWDTWNVDTPEFDADKFWEFLSNKLPSVGWIPGEVLFLISTKQLNSLQKIWKRQDVRLRDRFENKAHGPNDVFLFRYSHLKDWKRRVV